MPVAGASIVQDITICHHLETIQDDELTESERQRVRELVKHTLFDVFRKSKPQSQSLTPIEYSEVRPPINIVSLSLSKGGYVDKASVPMVWHTILNFASLKALSMMKRYLKTVISQVSVAI